MTFVLNPNAIRQLQGRVSKAVYKAGSRFASALKDTIESDGLVDERHLINSISVQSVDDTTVKVGTNLIHGRVMEYGRKPGKGVPTEALVGRAVRKGLARGNKTQGVEGLTKDTRHIPFLISRSIKRKGIKGRRWMSKTLKQQRQQILSDLSNI